jgi:serine/threonine protein kinase
VAKNAPGYIGPYRLLNIIHTGHASLVWQAYDDANQRVVGVKTLLDNSQRDREGIYFIRREFTIGRQLHHPNLIEIYDSPWDAQHPYFAMEWFASPNMKQRLQQGIDQKLAALIPKIISEAATALSYFHKMGWVHRDVKPDNFLVTDDGDVKLIDFALAKRRPRGIAKWFAMKPKLAQGTKSYISPEQIRGIPLDGRADIYSLACTLHELLSGKPPFTGTSVNDLLNKHLRTSPPSLEASNPNVTPEFAQLIRRSMAKNRDARPKTVDDFLREFRMMRVFRSMPTGNFPKTGTQGTDKT